MKRLPIIYRNLDEDEGSVLTGDVRGHIAKIKSDVEPRKNQASCSSSMKLVDNKVASWLKVANLMKRPDGPGRVGVHRKERAKKYTETVARMNRPTAMFDSL